MKLAEATTQLANALFDVSNDIIGIDEMTTEQRLPILDRMKGNADKMIESVSVITRTVTDVMALVTRLTPVHMRAPEPPAPILPIIVYHDKAWMMDGGEYANRKGWTEGVDYQTIVSWRAFEVYLDNPKYKGCPFIFVGENLTDHSDF